MKNLLKMFEFLFVWNGLPDDGVSATDFCFAKGGFFVVISAIQLAIKSNISAEAANLLSAVS